MDLTADRKRLAELEAENNQLRERVADLEVAVQGATNALERSAEPFDSACVMLRRVIGLDAAGADNAT